MPTLVQKGTADPVLNTPLTFYTSSANKNYAGFVNFDEMDTGDVTNLKINVKVLDTDSFDTVVNEDFEGVDGGLQSKIFLIPFIPGLYGIECIITQTSGTVRDYKYQLVEP